MSDDLISRKQAIEALCREECGFDRKGCKVGTCYDVEIIEDVPSVQPRKGKWIYADGTPVEPWAGYGVYCSACKEKSEYATNYCGMCGADMRGGSDG